MPEADEYRTMLRMTPEDHQMLVSITELAATSQNQSLLQCLRAVYEMIHASSDTELHVPELVIRARATKAHRARPQTIRYLTYENEELRVAESAHSKKKRPA